MFGAGNLQERTIPRTASWPSERLLTLKPEPKCLALQPSLQRQPPDPNLERIPSDRSLPPEASHRGGNRVFAGPALMLDTSVLPPSLSGYVAADLGIASAVGLAVDTFWSIQSAELQSEQGTASVRLAAVRLGPQVGFRIGSLEIACSALAGPALLWATASARAPRIGAANMTAAAIFSLRASLAYPREDLRVRLHGSGGLHAVATGSRAPELGGIGRFGSVPPGSRCRLGSSLGDVD